jgi:protocatechuate 3,4-dioxygenase beta subunit
MHRVFALFLGAVCLQAGVVQGVVLEHLSGRPLARTVVRLDPLAKATSQALSTRAGRSGHFVFPAVPPGTYFLTAVRSGYFPVAYGQRLPVGRGLPFEVTVDSNLFAELRVRHKGALTGRILDENGVGTEGVPVVAYRAKLPLRSAGSATSDDRGVYRIHGLDPGKYWVRSDVRILDDGSGWLPTYGPQARQVGDARVYLVGVDADTTDADISPDPGSLFRLGGIVTCDSEGPVTVTLSSETGRRRTGSNCPKGAYQFEGLAPGAYEVLATLQNGSASGFTELVLEQDFFAGNVQVMQAPTVDIEVRRALSNAVSDIPVTLIGRRQDVAETETSHEIAMARATLAPGHWEFRARVPAGQYVESIASLRGAARRPVKAERASDWYDVFIEPRFPSRIRITVSDQAAQITGRVMVDSSRPVSSAPVFLWPVAESARRSLGGPLQTLADTEGRFHFDSLPPGDYRMLASFDVFEIDEGMIELGRAVVVHAEALQIEMVELPVWIAPW